MEPRARSRRRLRPCACQVRWPYRSTAPAAPPLRAGRAVTSCRARARGAVSRLDPAVQVHKRVECLVAAVTSRATQMVQETDNLLLPHPDAPPSPTSPSRRPAANATAVTRMNPTTCPPNSRPAPPKVAPKLPSPPHTQRHNNPKPASNPARHATAHTRRLAAFQPTLPRRHHRCPAAQNLC